MKQEQKAENKPWGDTGRHSKTLEQAQGENTDGGRRGNTGREHGGKHSEGTQEGNTGREHGGNPEGTQEQTDKEHIQCWLTNKTQVETENRPK